MPAFLAILTATLFTATTTPVAAADDAVANHQEASATVVVIAPKADFQPSLASDLDEAALASLRPSTSDTANLLRDIPGVSLYSAGGISSLPAIHGLADDRVRVKVDGMDLVSACPNHMNSPLSSIDPNNVANVQVFAGLAPVSAGGDSIGGTIQVSSAPPEFAQPGKGVLFKGQAGTFYRSNGNAWGGHLAALVAGQTLSLTYNGSLARSGNYEAGSDFKAAGIAAMGQGWVDGDVVGSSRYESRNHDLGLAWRQDNHLVELKLGLADIPFEGFPNQRMDMTDNQSEHANLRYTGQHRWGVLEGRVYGEETRHKMNFAFDKQFWYGAGLDVPGMPMDTEGKNAGAFIKAGLAVSDESTLNAGGEYQRFGLDDWWSASGGGMAPNTFWNIKDGERDRLAVFAEWETRWNPAWASQLGVRSDTVMMDTGAVQGYNTTMGQYLAESTAFNARDRQRTDHNWDFTAIVRHTADTTQSFVAGYARKVRSPNLYERYAWSTGGMAMVMNNFAGDGNGYVGNLDLKPEVANTLSATADWHDAAKEQWGARVTPFYTYVQAFIDASRCSSANSGCGAANQTKTTGFVYLQYVNQSARLYGLDLSGHVQLAKASAFGSFTATGVLSYVRGENRTTGGNLYNIMPLNAKLAGVQHLGGWTNTVEAQFVAAKTKVSQVRDEVATGGYSLFHLRSSYVWRQIRFDLAVENLFNKLYSLPLGGAYVGQGMTMSGSGVPWGVPVPGMGRSIHIAANVEF